MTTEALILQLTGLKIIIAENGFSPGNDRNIPKLEREAILALDEAITKLEEGSNDQPGVPR
jgi:hypothetical protein